MGTEGWDASRLHGVHHAQGQGVVRSHHNKVHSISLGPGHHAVHIGGLHVYASGNLGDARIAGGTEKLGDFGGLGQFPADGVLPAAASYH